MVEKMKKQYTQNDPGRTFPDCCQQALTGTYRYTLGYSRQRFRGKHACPQQGTA